MSDRKNEELTPEEVAAKVRERKLEEKAEKHAQQVAGYVTAALLVPGGLTIGSRAGDALAPLVFAGVMVLGGLVAAFPQVFLPLAQDIVKKFLKDTPE